MTLEKAIEFGKIFLKTIEDEKGSAIYEFVETAVKMMEQEPYEDCISRQSVLNALCNDCELYKNEKQTCFSKCEEYHFLVTLPSVRSKIEQEPKTGHWIKYGIPRCEEQHYQCTNCKDYVNFGVWGDYYQKDFRYCPHCGCRMSEG